MKPIHNAKALSDALIMLERCIRLVRKHGLRESADLLQLAKADLQRHQHGITEQELEIAVSLLRCANLAKPGRRAPKLRSRHVRS